MLGTAIEDPQGVESAGRIEGLGWLPVRTVFGPDKVTRLVHAVDVASRAAGRRI